MLCHESGRREPGASAFDVPAGTKLEDEAVLQQFYEKAVSSVHLGENYLILLAHDTYDVPFRGKDGLLQDLQRRELQLRPVCNLPGEALKSALRYIAKEQEFQDKDAGWVVSMPALGFLFPAFDGRPDEYLQRPVLLQGPDPEL